MRKYKIVIPCRNESAYIEKCLQSLVDCNYDKNFLLVDVVDGISDDGTIEKIKKYTEKFSFIRLVINEKKTTPFALNLGLKSMDFDAGIILGAHSMIDAEYINECNAVFDQYPDVMCTGGFITNIFENSISSVISKAMSTPFGVGNAHFRTGVKSGYVDTVAFGAYKKEVFEKVGFFDEELVRNQDDEFNFRLNKNKLPIFLSDKIQSSYFVRASFKKLFQQYFQYGYWKVFVNKKHKAITTYRQLVPPLWILFLLMGWIPGIFFTPLILAYFSLVGIYFLAAFFIALVKSDPKKDFAKLFFTFLILHGSYGSGYLKGIIHFYILNKKPVAKSMKISR